MQVFLCNDLFNKLQKNVKNRKLFFCRRLKIVNLSKLFFEKNPDSLCSVNKLLATLAIYFIFMRKKNHVSIMKAERPCESANTTFEARPKAKLESCCFWPFFYQALTWMGQAAAGLLWVLLTASTLPAHLLENVQHDHQALLRWLSTKKLCSLGSFECARASTCSRPLLRAQ